MGLAETASQASRMSDDMKGALEAEAIADDRSVSSLVKHILRQWLEQRGSLMATKDAASALLANPKDEVQLTLGTWQADALDRARTELKRAARPKQQRNT